MSVPVIIANPGVNYPDQTCYVVGENGIFLRWLSPLITAMIRVDYCQTLQQSSLEVLQEYARIGIRPLPAKKFAQCFNFFFAAYKRFSAESGVLIYYHREEKRFLLYVPKQRVSSCNIDYEHRPDVPGYVLIGSIHSHHTMNAYHSGTDRHDEDFFNGIHFTVGRINEGNFSVAASIVVNHVRFPVEPADFICGLRKIKPWYAKRADEEDSAAAPIPETMSHIVAVPERTSTFRIESGRYRYQLDCPGTSDVSWRKCGFPKGWFGQVAKSSAWENIKDGVSRVFPRPSSSSPPATIHNVSLLGAGEETSCKH
ncbi:hypothetical protein COT97_01155 [Candidatus Falkowbacteria bacterium CG10_big_fil_rev_8_21_14_0_10_39_11]|uniref:JAB domain-containing protein n=1 Tax=Candidatus Falkowbacteria bacterium CG10_big_fil_rev_8_21_14_0_10_39_11 TaxID=1974565 RepID=A0A2H0V5V2_9BACT|nr:MAG: hypothetical protein COT97_01155 [Candidatus Falkowbacteria bacterium CG10_big_fil_rev_8_21_14_0_10_39_11]